MNLILTNPLDMHLHLREGDMLKSVLPFSAEFFSAGVVMPNLKTPITSTNLALEYKKNIESNSKNFTPLMTLYVTQNLTKNELLNAKNQGIKILKLYPKGATTNSENGMQEVLDEKSLEIFEMAQELGFMLSIHGESNGFCMDREFEFLSVFERLAKTFPKLKIIIEHMSDRRSLELIEKYENLYATLTLHHISMSLDSVLGGGINPHHFCKPMLKTNKDKDALLNAALNAHSKISFGSDSAPHLLNAKLSANGAAGIFSAPILLQKLCEIFESNKKLENLQKFISDNAIKNYELKNLINKKITLCKKPHKVPNSISTPQGEIIPLNAGEILSWSVESSEILGA